MTEEYRLPDLSPVLDAVFAELREWFPRVSAEKLDEVCFAIVHDALHVAHVEGPLWSILLDQPSELPRFKSRNR
jgi:hypothetical protein